MRQAAATKVCTGCRRDLPHEKFYTSHGNRARCKECHRADVKASGARITNRNRKLAARGKYAVASKVCRFCKTRKLAASFNRTNAMSDGLFAYCRACDRKRSSEWRKINGDKHREDARRWHHENRERALARLRARYAAHKDEYLQRNYAYAKAHRERANADTQRRRARTNGAAATLQREEAESVLRSARCRCTYCGRRAKKLTLDHIVPLSKGGEHARRNVVAACRNCNSRKGARPVEYLIARLAEMRVDDVRAIL